MSALLNANPQPKGTWRVASQRFEKVLAVMEKGLEKPTVTFVKFEHSAKASFLICVTVDGMKTFFIFLHDLKAFDPMVVTPEGIMTDESILHPRNTPYSIVFRD